MISSVLWRNAETNQVKWQTESQKFQFKIVEKTVTKKRGKNYQVENEGLDHKKVIQKVSRCASTLTWNSDSEWKFTSPDSEISVHLIWYICFLNLQLCNLTKA